MTSESGPPVWLFLLLSPGCVEASSFLPIPEVPEARSAIVVLEAGRSRKVLAVDLDDPLARVEARLEPGRRLFLLLYSATLEQLELSAGPVVPGPCALSCTLRSPLRAYMASLDSAPISLTEAPASSSILDLLVQDFYPRCTPCAALQATAVDAPRAGNLWLFESFNSRPDALFIQLNFDLFLVDPDGFRPVCTSPMLFNAALELSDGRIWLFARSDSAVLPAGSLPARGEQRELSPCVFVETSSTTLPDNRPSGRLVKRVVASGPGEPFEVFTLSVPDGESPDDLVGEVHRSTGGGFEKLGEVEVVKNYWVTDFMVRAEAGVVHVVTARPEIYEFRAGFGAERRDILDASGLSVERLTSFLGERRPDGFVETVGGRTGLDRSLILRREGSRWRSLFEEPIPGADLRSIRAFRGGLVFGLERELRQFYDGHGLCEEPEGFILPFEDTPEIYRVLPGDEGMILLGLQPSLATVRYQTWHVTHKNCVAD